VKAVLVGGDLGGIGMAKYREFATRGYHVSFTYRSNTAKAEDLAAELGAKASLSMVVIIFRGTRNA
jgi:short-subunit dehydrogenase